MVTQSQDATLAERTEYSPEVIRVRQLASFLAALRKVRSRETPALEARSKTVDEQKFRVFISKFNSLRTNLLQSGRDIDPWRVASLGKNEIRNSEVLRWLLDEKSSHGFGNLFLKYLLKNLNVAIPEDYLSNYATRTEVVLSEDEGRIDLIIDGKKFIIFIEVKINAAEGYGQLDKYIKALNQKSKEIGPILIYLTRSGERPQRAGYERVHPARWNQVAQAINYVLRDVGINSLTISGHILSRLARHMSKL